MEEFSDVMRLGQLRKEEEEYQQALEDLRHVQEMGEQVKEDGARERIKEDWDRAEYHKQLAYQAQKDLFETRLAMEETEHAVITFVKELKAVITDLEENCLCGQYDDCYCAFDCIDTIEAALDIVLEGHDG